MNDELGREIGCLQQPWGDDELGRILSIPSRTGGHVRLGEAGNKSKMTCWYCSKLGHSAHTCKARIVAGAEVPKQAPKKTDLPPTTPKRQGGEKGSTL